MVAVLVDGDENVLAFQNLRSLETTFSCPGLDSVVATPLHALKKVRAEDYGPLPFPFKEKPGVGGDRLVIQPAAWIHHPVKNITANPDRFTWILEGHFDVGNVALLHTTLFGFNFPANCGGFLQFSTMQRPYHFPSSLEARQKKNQKNISIRELW